MEIRKLDEAEIKNAMKLVWEVFLEFEAPEYSKKGIQSFKSFINAENTPRAIEMYGAFADGTLVGVIATRSAGTHITLFFVDKKYQGQSIGRKLFETLIENSVADEITVNSSPFAVNIYRRLGFEDTDTEQTKDGIRYTPMRLKR